MAIQQFNHSLPSWMHIDLNSCFATIEQQANPHLRGLPIAVAAYTTPCGCILAPSIEAKRFGVKTGMQVREGKDLCPRLIILPSDPPKYRFVNQALKKLFNEYSPHVSVRSIDEMLLDFNWTQVTGGARNPPVSGQFGVHLFDPDILKNIIRSRESSKRELGNAHDSLPAGLAGIYTNNQLINIAREIKTRIKFEIGEWLTVSVGISTNPYLAKLAAGLHKPDGLDEINSQNILSVLSTLKLVDLPYIKERNALRLNSVGIKTTTDFYFATQQQLKSAFQSINGYYWYLRLHGRSVDEIEWQRKSIGHQYALPKRTTNVAEIEQLLCKLVEKVGRRIRRNNLTAQGIHLSLGYDGGYWHKGHKLQEPIFTNTDLFISGKQLLQQALPLKPVRLLAVTCFNLAENLYTQTTLFHDELKKRALTQALDIINDRFGEFSVVPATMLGIHHEGKILDRIAFSGVRDLAEVVLKEDQQLEREEFY